MTLVGEDLELFDRSLRAATEQHSGDALDAAIAELGWHDALEFDPRAAVSCLFEAQGAAGATSSALDHVVAHAIGRELHGSTSVVLPAIGRWSAPGVVGDGRLAVRGVSTNPRTSMLVVARSGDVHVVGVIDPAGLETRSVRGVDPWLGLVEVGGEVALGDTTEVEWSEAVALAQLAVAHQLVGASRTALALAREHALDRIQFGQPIAQFQAVRHRLADALVAVEAASAVLDAAWLDRSAVNATMAKATAGRGGRTVARHCQQVLAGIGFTTEHDLHRYVRRILALDQLFGSHAMLTKRLGDEILATRRLPPLLAL
ncbi:MAG: acyl-CoA dehydrogenase family protein [Acidimicrobiia bacterium]